MDARENRNAAETLVAGGETYRVIDAAPSGRYAVAQQAKYVSRMRGPRGHSMYMDAPAVLFDLGGAEPERLGEQWCPFDLLEGPALQDVIWYEREGFVKLCFGAIELPEIRNKRIYFRGGREGR